jgi:hypothetical protein
MPAINEKALSQYIGILEAAKYETPTVFTRLASVRGLINTSSFEQIKIKADDTGLLLSITKPNSTIETQLLEVFDVDLMDILMPGTKTVVAGTPVPVVDEVLATAGNWTQGVPLKIDNKNGADTEVASITVEEDGGATLVLDTNYRVYVADGSNGDTGYTYIVPLTANANQILVSYTYTPNQSNKYSIQKVAQVMPRLVVRITAVDPLTSNTRIILLTDAVMSGDYALEFLDVVEAGDLNGASLVFELNEGGYVDITDGINIA